MPQAYLAAADGSPQSDELKHPVQLVLRLVQTRIARQVIPRVLVCGVAFDLHADRGPEASQ